jgi:phosphoglycolate phosphatase-like HAD superfamily hydrolase
MKLFLFDIDGTLLQSHGLGGKAFSEALTVVTGKTYDLRKYDWFGQTDGAILTEILTEFGYDTAEIDAIKPSVFAEFTKRLECP